MRILKTGTLCVLLHAFALSSSAQKTPPVTEPDYNKPKLFADLPEKFSLDTKAFEALLNLPVGQAINVPLTAGLRFHGAVVSKSDPIDPNVKSVVIKSSNRQGAVFTFTRLRNTDGSFSYNGLLLSQKHSDAFEIIQEDGLYVLRKKQFYDLINE